MRHKGSIGMVSVVGLASLSLLGLIGWGILVVQACSVGESLGIGSSHANPYEL